MQAGTYHVMVEAYSAINGVSLVASYTPPTGNDPINYTVSNITINAGQLRHYKQELDAGYSSMTVTISGNNGDADLYLRHGSLATTSLYDCKSETANSNETCTITAPTAGDWYIAINGSSAASSISMSVQANP